jgi:hypothetical protein
MEIFAQCPAYAGHRIFEGLSENRPDTVGQPPSTEIGVLNMSSWKAKKLRKLPQEKVLLEL